MRNKKVAIFILILSSILLAISSAQGPSQSIPPVENRVFRITCTDQYSKELKRMIQTGFYTSVTVHGNSVRAIWTALHGVVRCRDLTINAESETGIVVSKLRIAWVAEKHDSVLLVPDGKTTIGQEIRPEIQPLRLAQGLGKAPFFWVIGYPLGKPTVSRPQASPDKSKYLIDALSSDYAIPLSNRNSPHKCLVVQEINGPGIVNQGMSGSPLVGADGLVYGMVDGGIGRKGQESESIGWVISTFPLSTDNSCIEKVSQEFDWQEWDSLSLRRKRDLATDTSGLVSFDYEGDRSLVSDVDVALVKNEIRIRINLAKQYLLKWSGPRDDNNWTEAAVELFTKTHRAGAQLNSKNLIELLQDLKRSRLQQEEASNIDAAILKLSNQSQHYSPLWQRYTDNERREVVAILMKDLTNCFGLSSICQ